MLDNKKQIKAFKILNASSPVTPDSVNYSISAKVEAKAIGEMLSDSVEDGITYPVSVMEYITEIARLAFAMDSVASNAQQFTDAVTPFISPSELLQMKLGWDCHVRGNEIEPTPAFSLVEGIEDKTVAAGLFNALSIVDATPVASVMADINIILAGGVVLIVPDEQVQALAEAVADLSKEVVVVESASAELSQLAADIAASTSVSKKALKDAVDITITNTLINDALMSGAIAQIMPAGVISALSEVDL